MLIRLHSRLRTRRRQRLRPRRRPACSGAIGKILAARTPRRRAVASWGVHRLDVFAQAAGQRMLHQTYDGKFWYPADDLGPAIVGSPGAVAWGPDRLDVFVRGTDNQLWQMAYAGGSLGRLLPLGRLPDVKPSGGLVGGEPARCLHEGRRQCAVSRVVERVWLEPVRAARRKPQGRAGSHFARPEPDRRLLSRAQQPPLSAVLRRLDLAATLSTSVVGNASTSQCPVGDCGGSISSARVTTTACSTDRGTAEVGPAGRPSAATSTTRRQRSRGTKTGSTSLPSAATGTCMHKHLSEN